MNTFGDKFRFTSFGESHGPAIGGVLDGVPAGVRVNLDRVYEELDRRAGRVPASDASGNATSENTSRPVVSQRALSEPDRVEWLSGLMDGVTTGAPIAYIIRNKTARPEDYDHLRHILRPGHADATYLSKYGIRDHRGGGRASARETASRVVAGTIARQMVEEQGMHIHAWVSNLYGQPLPDDPLLLRSHLAALVSQFPGDSFGAVVSCVITGMKTGLGEPVFGKLQARLAEAMFSINACKGFEYGVGFDSANHRGSEINATSGGLLGGISDGSDLTFRVAFKPTPSIALEQDALTVDGLPVKLQIHGRHDPCLAVRAVPVVEAMAALVLADMML